MSSFDQNISPFDQIISRKNTNSLKYDFVTERGRPENVLPLWVADMDFKAPECVLEALAARVDHGIFGYSAVKQPYFDAVAGWFSRHYNWQIQREWLITTPGVVFALAMAIRALSQPGDGVLIMPPVYYPFYEVIGDNERRIVECPLTETEGRYILNFETLERIILVEHPKILLLCSPHNPVGKVWTQDELRKIGDLCARNHIAVIADEIHCDFALPGHPFTPFLIACPELAESTIVCTSPSKTFGLAGLQISNILIPGRDLHRRFSHQVAASGYSQPNIMGLIACQAAYEDGDEWHEENLQYLQGNLAYFRTFLQDTLPELRLIEPEGTYFAWVNCSGLNLLPGRLNEFITNRANLWLDAGGIFGSAWGQYQRFVLATPRSVLVQALCQLELAVREHRGSFV